MSSNRYRVLLVEDEDLISMLTEDMLVDLGYEVSASVATLEEGLKVALEREFDLAVLDINLRGKMSFPIAEVLSEKGVPFLFASGYAQGIEPRFSDRPALQKPFTVERLKQALHKAIGMGKFV